MNNRIPLLLVLILNFNAMNNNSTLAAEAHNAAVSQNAEALGNPFLHAYTTAHEAVPFDKIRLEHYMPAIKEGIRLHQAEIDAIVANQEAPTFDNTIAALERSGEVLDKVTNVFFNLLECDGTNEMMLLSEEIQPLLSEHSNNISLNEGLFHRIETVWNNRQSANLTAEQAMVLKKTYEDYLLNGAALEAGKRERWRAINSELDSLTLVYGQNALKATQAYTLLLTEKEDLVGLPNFVITAMAEAAESAGQKGWMLTLQAPSYRPFMTYSSRRDLREKLYKAYNTRAALEETDYNNFDNIRRITALRLEKAQLMGKKNYAEYKLQNTMAHDEATVKDLLNKLLEAYKASALADIQELQDFADKFEKQHIELMPWDFMYYSDLLKKDKYAVNDELLKPYFPLEQVKKGIFGLAHTLYGVNFTQVYDVPKYHPEVDTYEVTDCDGKFMGLLYADFFPRATKRSGAWMTEFKGQWHNADGTDSRPLISIVTSFTRPQADTPSLLTYDEANTFLHEFGHALHGLLTRCSYPSVSGTNVAHDFVELPSQFMENFLEQKQFLDTFACHYKTGEAIPNDLIERIHKAKNYQAGYSCLRQITFGMLDMAYHTITSPIEGSLADFELKETARTQMMPRVPGTMISTAFTHIFSGGYAAGYYGYKWAEVLDADAFSVFEQHGIFDQATAKKFLHLLESGGSIEPAQLYREFKGADPSIDALMKRDGILK